MKHLYIMGLSDNPTCRKCGTEEETSVHILCECETLVSLRHAYVGSFFLDREDVMNLPIFRPKRRTVIFYLEILEKKIMMNVF